MWLWVICRCYHMLNPWVICCLVNRQILLQGNHICALYMELILSNFSLLLCFSSTWFAHLSWYTIGFSFCAHYLDCSMVTNLSSRNLLSIFAFRSRNLLSTKQQTSFSLFSLAHCIATMSFDLQSFIWFF